MVGSSRLPGLVSLLLFGHGEYAKQGQRLTRNATNNFTGMRFHHWYARRCHGISMLQSRMNTDRTSAHPYHLERPEAHPGGRCQFEYHRTGGHVWLRLSEPQWDLVANDLQTSCQTGRRPSM